MLVASAPYTGTAASVGAQCRHKSSCGAGWQRGWSVTDQGSDVASRFGQQGLLLLRPISLRTTTLRTMAYGQPLSLSFHQLAALVDKILREAEPAYMPARISPSRSISRPPVRSGLPSRPIWSRAHQQSPLHLLVPGASPTRSPRRGHSALARVCKWHISAMHRSDREWADSALRVVQLP
jgi:hypothetical protein